MKKDGITMAGFAAAVALGCGLAGCGLPGPPQPPSLQLPRIVTDLQAQRVGDAVHLSWTVPRETTDKATVKGTVTASICVETNASVCEPVLAQSATAGAEATAQQQLPADLAAGPPRSVRYQVELKNAHGRSAGWSAPVAVLAGEAPPAVTGLQAQSTANGVKLAWQNGSYQPEGGDLVYRITRTQLTPEPATAAEKKSPQVETLEVAAKAPIAEAMDRNAAWNQQYRYQVQAVLVARVDDGAEPRRLEMLGIASNPAEVATKNVFPPAAPQGLVGVAIWGKDGKPAVDLNWQPNIEPTVVGYQVYRVSRMQNRSLARRTMASGDKVLSASAFTDRDLQPGTEYEYTVIAVDKDRNVSAESDPVRVTTLTQPD